MRQALAVSLDFVYLEASDHFLLWGFVLVISKNINQPQNQRNLSPSSCSNDQHWALSVSRTRFVDRLIHNLTCFPSLCKALNLLKWQPTLLCSRKVAEKSFNWFYFSRYIQAKLRLQQVCQTYEPARGTIRPLRWFLKVWKWHRRRYSNCKSYS